MAGDIVWSERAIATVLAQQFFARKYLVMVPNCNWTGHECDLLCVTENLRIIDVEIKISRSDLKADAKKDKWWHHLSFAEARQKGIDTKTWNPREHRTPMEWPRKVWKHYYAMPADIWKPELMDSLPSPRSGVLLLSTDSRGRLTYSCERRATPSKEAEKIKPEAVVDIARLASLRMWDSYAQLDARRAA